MSRGTGNESIIYNNSHGNTFKSLDSYDMTIKVAFALVSGLFILAASIALLALNRTRKTPSTARFLSSGLICFDILAILFFTIRKFIDDHNLNILIQVVGVNFCFLAYVTVGFMSLERLIIFYSPHFYLRRITPTIVKRAVCIVWIVVIISYNFVRFGACYMSYPDFTLHDVVGKCNTVSFLYYLISIAGVLIISVACYVKIYRIVKNEKRNSNEPSTLKATAKHIQNYKSTSLVFVYMVTITITSLGYAITLLLDLSTVPLRLAIDSVNYFNCFMDPIMYILWYSECRLEMLKMVAIFYPSLSNNIEKMRLKVFQIVTKENICRQRSNKIHPIVFDHIATSE